MTLRVAFVGCGGIGEHYLSVYRDLSWVQIDVCVDANLARAQQAAQMLAANPAKPRALATADFNAALAPEIDVVVINTPNHLHREQAIAALQTGKHLLLQKPVAQNVAEAEAIAAAATIAQARGIQAGLYLSYFDQPLMHDLRAMAQAGWFGDLAHGNARLMHRGGLRVSEQVQSGEANWRASLAQTGGGCFIQLAVHFVHLFKWIMDARVTRVMAMAKNLHCPGIEGEDIACALLEFDNGAIATVETAWNTAGELFSLGGTKGAAEYIGNQTLVLDSSAGAFAGHVVQYASASASTSPGAPGAAAPKQTSTISAPPLGDVTNPFNQHVQFLQAVRAGQAPFVSINAGLDDLRIVAAVYESARRGQAIAL